MTEILFTTLTAKLRNQTIKKKASHPLLIRESDVTFRKQQDNLEQEKLEKVKLQYVNKVQTTISYIKNIQDSDNQLEEKFTKILNI